MPTLEMNHTRHEKAASLVGPISPARAKWNSIWLSDCAGDELRILWLRPRRDYPFYLHENICTANGVAQLGLAINRMWHDESDEKREETVFVDVTPPGGRLAKSPSNTWTKVVRCYRRPGQERLIPLINFSRSRRIRQALLSLDPQTRNALFNMQHMCADEIDGSRKRWSDPH